MHMLTYLKPTTRQNIISYLNIYMTNHNLSVCHSKTRITSNSADSPAFLDG